MAERESKEEPTNRAKPTLEEIEIELFNYIRSPLPCKGYWIAEHCPGSSEFPPHTILCLEMNCLAIPCDGNRAPRGHVHVPEGNSEYSPVQGYFFERWPGWICWECRVADKASTWRLSSTNSTITAAWVMDLIANNENMSIEQKYETMQPITDAAYRWAEEELVRAGLGPDRHGR